MSAAGNQRGGGSPHMNQQRRDRAAAKLLTPIGAQDYPLPPPVKRHAITAALELSPTQARTSRLAGAS